MFSEGSKACFQQTHSKGSVLKGVVRSNQAHTNGTVKQRRQQLYSSLNLNISKLKDSAWKNHTVVYLFNNVAFTMI